MNDFFRFTKFKLLLSYLLVLVISIGATFFIYEKIKLLISPSAEEALMRKKSRLVNTILLDLFHIEELSRRSIIQTSRNSAEMKQIQDLMISTDSRLDSLAVLSESLIQKEKLSSIKVLLEQKNNNINKLINYIDNVKTDSVFHRSMKQILNVSKNEEEPVAVIKKEIVKKDTVFVKNKQRKFFQRIADVFSPPKSDSTPQIVTSVQLKSDTLVSKVNTKDTVQKAFTQLITDLKIEQEYNRKQVMAREKLLTESNEALTNSINQLLFEFGEEEIQNAIVKIEASHDILKEIILIALIITVLSFVIALVSLIFISKDISQSQHYRKELEEEKRVTENLLKHREQLILSITHDIKSPLNSILGYLGFINDNELPDKDMLDNMLSSSNHILDLVNSLLDFNRLEKGIIIKKEEVFDSRNLFHSIFTSFQPEANKKHLILQNSISADLGCYLGDDFRIRQIVTNLLSNAIKYTNEGTVQLDVSWINTLPGNGRLVIKVIDSGSGLTEEEIQSIFKEFSRLKEHQNVEGLGLGLAITQRLISLLDGTIIVESVKGKGSVFTVEIPLLIRNCEDLPAIIEVNSCPVILHKSQTNILLVDDDPIQLNMLEKILKKHNYNVDFVNNPLSVLDKLKNKKYDVLITDIQMRDFSGLDLIKLVREKYSKENLKVVALSGLSGVSSEYMNLGFDAFLSKPVSVNELLNCINSLIVSMPLTYNLDDLLAFSGGDQELSLDLIKTFISESRINLKNIIFAISNKDLNEIQSLAHKMKSSFKLIHADSIAEELYMIEKSTDCFEEIKDKLDLLIPEIDKLIDSLECNCG